jgi:hypothetical protein
VVLVLAAGLLGLVAAVVAVAVGGRAVLLELRRRAAQAQQQQAEREPPVSAMVHLRAGQLEVGAVVITRSTPYRWKQEQVVWLERQPMMGPVVALLQSPDPETGEEQQRWHQWPAMEQVTQHVGEVDTDDFAPRGDFGGLYQKFGERVSYGDETEGAVVLPEVVEVEEDPQPGPPELVLPWDPP